jgi:hypothetical protein
LGSGGRRPIPSFCWRGAIRAKAKLLERGSSSDSLIQAALRCESPSTLPGKSPPPASTPTTSCRGILCGTLLLQRGQKTQGGGAFLLGGRRNGVAHGTSEQVRLKYVALSPRFVFSVLLTKKKGPPGGSVLAKGTWIKRQRG